jgi:crossover junction endodeoxyribonuclease RusA
MESGMGEPSPAGELTLVLPVPPSINHQYATVQGRRVLSRAGREFKAFVAETVECWLDDHPEMDVGLFQRHYLALTITFYFATVLRRDLDGGLKIAQDALCEALGVNDNLVIEIHLSKRVDRHCPRIEARLTALAGEAVTLEAGREAHSTLPLPASYNGMSKRRRRRKQRSLEELAARHKWDKQPLHCLGE